MPNPTFEQRMLEIRRLRQFAENATRGPWVVSQTDNGCVSGDTPTGWVCSGQNPADARYIAALNPTVVLAMLRRLEDFELDHA